MHPSFALVSALDLSRSDGASFNWLRRSLFTPSSRSLRQVAASIVMALAQQQGVQRKQDILDMLTWYDSGQKSAYLVHRSKTSAHEWHL